MTATYTFVARTAFHPNGRGLNWSQSDKELEMKMRAVAAAIVLLTILLTLCAGRAGAQDLSPQGKAASAAYFQCLRRAARTVDDGKSDASTIALGVVGQCRASISVYALATSHGSFEKQTNADGVEQRAVADATAAVVTMRKRNERRLARRAYLVRIWRAATGRKRQQ